MKHHSIIILGAGPTGLGAAYALTEAGHSDWTLYEAESEVGGLAKSFVDAYGCNWDIGIHAVFSHYPYFDQMLARLFTQDEWLEHIRETWIRLLDTWVPYPFQNNLHRLPRVECAACLEGLITARISNNLKQYSSFQDYIINAFGNRIAKLFMEPYNFKVWAHPLDKMGVGWLGDRVACPDPARAARNAVMQQDDVGWGPNSTFRSPVSGGIGGVWKRVAQSLPENRIHLGKRATSIDPWKRTVTFSDGDTVKYDHLISTLPLDVLAEMCEMRDWKEEAENLSYSSVNLVGVVVDGQPGPEIANKSWIYFPEPDCPFYRVTNHTLCSPQNVPDPTKQWSLICEVSESAHKPVAHDLLVQDVLTGLVNKGIIQNESQVHHCWTYRVEHGYPTPTITRDATLDWLLWELEQHNIYSRGRFGAWKYEVGNMDHSFMQGVESIRRLLYTEAETTVWNPEDVNGR